jgi:hypothetical protein
MRMSRVRFLFPALDITMKEITLKFDKKFYKRLNEARKLEAPEIRNTKFCKELVEAMVGAIEDDHKPKGGKRGSNKK